MPLRKVLRDFVKVVSDEADRNPDFAERLQAALQPEIAKRPVRKISAPRKTASKSIRPANRRPPAVLDPVALAVEGEEALRAQLTPLTLEQLKDIVADYGMDREKLVMKWKTPGRIIDRIVEISISRARKGDAFRS